MSLPIDDRTRRLSDAPVHPARGYILYWMTAQRRLQRNHALERAARWSSHLAKPLLIFEPLRCDYAWASDRLHRFVIDGMMDNAKAAAALGVAYLPYIEPSRHAAKGLLAALSQDACVVLGDEHPGFFHPRAAQAAAQQLGVRFELVDSCGVVPLSRHEQVYTTAHSFRRFLHKALPQALAEAPSEEPLRGAHLDRMATLPSEAVARWGLALGAPHDPSPELLSTLPIDHRVRPVLGARGGRVHGMTLARRFLSQNLSRYGERNEPDAGVSSTLSPWLHFGHVSPWDVLGPILERAAWTAPKASDVQGSRAGWWGLDEPTEGFLDQLITWREVGFNACARMPNYDKYESLPAWALKTLDEHRKDKRANTYDLQAFDEAKTHDEVWNAAQRQLKAEGVIHNYMRMLWGKKILEWSETPEQALEVLIELNNRYALDGRDPNSYSGIFWVLGRYDRAFGPERSVLGLVRYMSSDNTKRKLDLDGYLRRWRA